MSDKPPQARYIADIMAVHHITEHGDVHIVPEELASSCGINILCLRESANTQPIHELTLYKETPRTCERHWSGE